MVEIHKNLFIGSENNCTLNTVNGLAVIHACKYPCHAKAVGYKGNLPKNHPHYLIMERQSHLFLNMVDMEQELHPLFTNPIMQAAMNFIDKNIETNKVLIHCNQGISRSPSIGLLYLAKKRIISNGKFNDALSEFVKLYPYYQPGKGIALYLAKNWNDLMSI